MHEIRFLAGAQPQTHAADGAPSDHLAKI